MAFDGKEGKVVTLAEAAAWTAAYRDANPGEVKAHFIGKDKINSILGQTGCMGIRVYHGIIEGEGPCLVFVGADANGRDMQDGIIVERAPKCPPYCDDNSALS